MDAVKYELKIYYDSNDRLEYILKSEPGSRTDKPVWQIFKLFYDGSTENILKLSYADNTSLFQFIADDYLNYKYTPLYETYIIPLKNLTPDYIFDLTASNSDYDLTGDTADLLVSEALFNNADFITIKEGTTLYEKGSVAVWQSQSTIKFNNSSEKGKSIYIKS